MIVFFLFVTFELINPFTQLVEFILQITDIIRLIFDGSTDNILKVFEIFVNIQIFKLFANVHFEVQFRAQV